MKNRIREIRESLTDENGKKLTQVKFAEKLGVSFSTAQKWEIGAAAPNNSAIELICDRCGINELWLRTGTGPMKPEKSRSEELYNAVGDLLKDRKPSFKTALVTTLLKFEPDGKEWAVLEDIYNSVAAEMKKEE